MWCGTRRQQAQKWGTIKRLGGRLRRRCTGRALSLFVGWHQPISNHSSTLLRQAPLPTSVSPIRACAAICKCIAWQQRMWLVSWVWLVAVRQHQVRQLPPRRGSQCTRAGILICQSLLRPPQPFPQALNLSLRVICVGIPGLFCLLLLLLLSPPLLALLPAPLGGGTGTLLLAHCVLRRKPLQKVRPSHSRAMAVA